MSRTSRILVGPHKNVVGTSASCDALIDLHRNSTTSIDCGATRILGALVLVIFCALLLGCGPDRLYTVQAGDNLQQIALRNNTTVSAIVLLNKDRYPSLETNPGGIRPGWELQIPSGDGVALEFESLLMRIAQTTNQPTSPETPIAAAPNDKINLVVERIMEGINQTRLEKNLRPLGMDANLADIAQVRSNDMITREFFSHTDPGTGQVLFQGLLQQHEYSYMFAGENIAEIRNEGAFVPETFSVYERYSADDLAGQFVTGWINSPEHYANIINPHFLRTGVAIGVTLDGTRVVATQVFTD